MDVFEFLLLHKHSADDDSEDQDVELVDDEQLGLLIEELPLFVVIFYKVFKFTNLKIFNFTIAITNG